MNPIIPRLAFALLCLAMSLVLAVGEEAGVTFDDFVGAEVCARCHQKQYDLWKASTHGRAGGLPQETKIVARFDGQPLYFRDAVVTPTNTTRGDPFFRVAVEGLPPLDILVDAVVGGGHMLGGGTQSFFHRHADGTLRFLPFDFIRRENVWFVQLRSDLSWSPVNRQIALATDLANWPPQRVLGTVTELSNCQNCHGSQIVAGWDESEKRFRTRFQSLRINCESCHGPGRKHLEIVSQPGFENQPELGMQPLAVLSKETSVNLCLQCHAAKEVLREEPYLPGKPLEDYFSLKLPLLGDNPYHIDGRIRSFSYQGNHLFSDCYRSGSMTCVDCHDPHAQTYRDVFQRPLPDRFDNGQCTGCHASKEAAPERHSHHKIGSPGNACVACHMPYLQAPAVGDLLQFARSDHSIPIPRPAFDNQLGIENACQKCHRDHDLAWQQNHTTQWWGRLKPQPPAITNSLLALSVTDPVQAAALLLQPNAGHPMGETAALALWLRRFLHSGMAREPRLVTPLMAIAQNEDPDLRALGLMALDTGFGEQQPVQEFLRAQTRSAAPLPDAIRWRWSIAADMLASTYAGRGQSAEAKHFLQKSIKANPDNFVSMSHLALASLQAGDAEACVRWLQRAIQIRPNKAVLHFQLGQTLARLGRIAEAIDSLEAGLRLAPEEPSANRLLQQLREK